MTKNENISAHNNKIRKRFAAAFSTVSPEKAQEIREAYYKACEGLETLSLSLEIADSEAGEYTNGILLEEHYIARMALDQLERSELGVYL